MAIINILAVWLPLAAAVYLMMREREKQYGVLYSRRTLGLAIVFAPISVFPLAYWAYWFYYAPDKY